MKIQIFFFGKTKEKYLLEGISHYQKRLTHYLPVEVVYLPDIKSSGKYSTDQQKEKEGEVILQHLKNFDYVVLLDERGIEYTSLKFAELLQHKMLSGIKNIVFVTGGAYGYSNKVYKRANMQLSLSKMTFSHQMIRLIFLEQLYRGMTIIKGEPYHHE